VSLNALVDPEANTALQVLLDERKEGKRKRNRGETEADGQAVEEIVAMGFDRRVGELAFFDVKCLACRVRRHYSVSTLVR
jgi:hypothetical protein